MHKVKNWNALAKSYSTKHEQNIKQVANILRHALGLTYLTQQDNTILDAGCGSGESIALELKRNLQVPAKVVGLDFSQEMVSLAQARLNELDRKGVSPDVKVEIMEGDIQALPFEGSDIYDYYVSNFCFNLVPNPTLGIQEAYRVMKKGGQIGITIPAEFHEERLYTDLESAVIESNCDPASVREFCQAHFGKFSRESFIELLEKCGFEVESCWYQQFLISLSSVEDLTTFHGYFLKEFSESDKERIIRKHAEKIEETKKQKLQYHQNALFIIGRK